MELDPNTFASACFERFSIEDLVIAQNGAADEMDMEVWVLSVSEWHNSIFEALVLKLQMSVEITIDT